MRTWTGHLVAGLTALGAGAACGQEAGPSFDCAQERMGSVEQRICKDPRLAALDREMATAYAAARGKVRRTDAQALTDAQRGWIRVRDDCWKSTDVPACIEKAYRDRISELTARYRLVEPIGSGRYRCPGPPPQEATADFFATDPPTAMVTYAGESQFMRQAPSGSGARYTGGNRQFWEHQGVALINWNLRLGEMQCPKQDK
jgi:uncharacterized protein